MGDSFKDILREAGEHFDAVVAEQPQNLRCGIACTMCCHGLFEIGAADVAVIAEALPRLDPAVRETILARAEAVAAATDHPNLREVSEAEREAFFERTENLPCPALDDEGRCSIYEFRPLVCRTFGLPIREGSRYIGEECELNFTAASQDEKERAAWDLLREDILGPEDQFTVPEALLIAGRLANP